MSWIAFAFAWCFIGATMAICQAETLTADVSFHAVGSPGFVTIDGKGATASGVLTRGAGKVSGVFSCHLDALTTGIGLRDEHMKTKYLNTATYPAAVLVLSPATPLPAGDWPWSGTLTLKGVSKPVSGTATVTGSAFLAKFSVTLDDFGIGVPSYLRVTVAKTVSVQVSGLVK